MAWLLEHFRLRSRPRASMPRESSVSGPARGPVRPPSCGRAGLARCTSSPLGLKGIDDECDDGVQQHDAKDHKITSGVLVRGSAACRQSSGPVTVLSGAKPLRPKGAVS